VRIAQTSRLSRLLPLAEQLEVQVNSSHHQAIRVPGDRLLVSAVSPQDGVIEAVELDAADHFVLAVQCIRSGPTRKVRYHAPSSRLCAGR